MFGTTVAAALLLAPAAPVPAQPPVPAVRADRIKAHEFARIVWQAADMLALRYERPVEPRALVRAAVQGLYEECGRAVPHAVTRVLAAANGPTELVEALADVRLLLAEEPALLGPRALVAAIDGFRHATESLCRLTSPRANAFASSEMDFGIGLELEGVTGKAWMLYQAEHRAGRGELVTAGWLGPVPPPPELNAPAALPWRVSRVVPESPAARAGVRPGDTITHIFGTEITPKNANALFSAFAFPHVTFDPQTGQVRPAERAFTFRRGPAKTFETKIAATPFAPMSAFGVMRTPEDKWDCLLDREHKIGYVRIGAVEQGLDVRVGELVADLERRGCRGLILDLRWCPGGYLDPAEQIAGLFLPNGAVIYSSRSRPSVAPERPVEKRNPAGRGRHTKLPLAVLVGQQTTGGGELIAAALRDNDRCVLIGQRTVGRASIQQVYDVGFGGLQLKVTTGESFRPNGKPRRRNADSGPLDDWGLRPDPGLEVPVTTDKAQELGRWADLHALRPAGSDEALDFDDPLLDPFRAKALEYLKAKLGKPPEKK